MESFFRFTKDIILSSVIFATDTKSPCMIVRIVFLSLFLLLLPILSFPVMDGEDGNPPDTKPKPAPKATPSIFIMGKGEQSVTRMVDFMLDFNSKLDTNYLRKVLKIYISECTLEGINYDVAVCQMCLETGFLRFNGSVSRFQNNYCGLGAINSLAAGDWFGSMEEGIRAHIQHLKAYCSLEPLKTKQVDMRFHNVKRGIVFTIYDLTGRWATDPRYGDKIHYLIKKLYNH